MTAPATPTASPPRRRRGWDIALSVFLLLLAGATGFFGLILAFFTLAFLDYCPPETCSVDGAVSAQFAAGIAVLLTIAAGVIGTVVMLVRKRRGWWVALLTFLGVIAFWLIGLLLYGAAVS